MKTLLRVEFPTSGWAEGRFHVSVFEDGTLGCTCPLARYSAKSGSGYRVFGKDFPGCRHVEVARTMPEVTQALKSAKVKPKPESEMMSTEDVAELFGIPMEPLHEAAKPKVDAQQTAILRSRIKAAESEADHLRREIQRLKKLASKRGSDLTAPSPPAELGERQIRLPVQQPESPKEEGLGQQ